MSLISTVLCLLFFYLPYWVGAEGPLCLDELVWILASCPFSGSGGP